MIHTCAWVCKAQNDIMLKKYFTLSLHFEFNVESGVRMEFALVTFSLSFTYTHSHIQFLTVVLYHQIFFLSLCPFVHLWSQCTTEWVSVCVCVSSLEYYSILSIFVCIVYSAYNSLLCFHFYFINIFYSKTKKKKKKNTHKYCLVVFNICILFL